MALGLLALAMYISCIFHVYFMYISCIFHVVCASFSALATRELADANAVFSGIWAKGLTTVVGRPRSKMVISTDHNKGFRKAMHQIKA